MPNILTAAIIIRMHLTGLNVDQFIPYLDYKERAQQWHWIGFGRDSDDVLTKWCDHWLKHKEEVAELIVDSSQGSPPPARWYVNPFESQLIDVKMCPYYRKFIIYLFYRQVPHYLYRYLSLSV